MEADMTFQRTLNLGDIITIKRAETLCLVIKSGRRESPDIGRGDVYWVDEIEVVDIAMDRWGKPMQTVQYTEPKVRCFYFEGNGGMRGKGKMIKDSDIKVVGTSHLTTYTTTTHVMEGVHYYGNQ
jgi:hypothetical protein